MANNEPFLKWAGGKRWLVKQHPYLLPSFEGKYIEPFLGGGAVFFHLEPQNALLSDKNDELITTYQVVRDAPEELELCLKRIQNLHCSSYYYKARSSKPSNLIDRAARFIYLNRTCFNGLYRVNSSGDFNVPIGSKTTVEFPEGNLTRLSVVLKSAALQTADFESSIDSAKKGDFLFIDPPYTVSHNNNGFIKYNDVLFSWTDQLRLADAVARASKRGVLILVSNANHQQLIELYTCFMEHLILKRASILSGKRDGRRSTEEAAFINYTPEAAELKRHTDRCTSI